MLYSPPSPRPFIYAPPSAPLQVLHADDDLLAVFKPSGLLSVPGKADTHKDSVQTRIAKTYPESLLIHRLDVGTSGVILFARNKAAQRHVGLQFEKRYTRKTYVARVSGHVQGESGRINLPLTTDWPFRPRQMVSFEHGRSAVTDWVIADRSEGETRLTLHPITGRSHQLRVHLAMIGHPILGDRIYAPDTAFTAAERLQLHAETLVIRHPSGGAETVLTAPCPF